MVEQQVPKLRPALPVQAHDLAVQHGQSFIACTSRDVLRKVRVNDANGLPLRGIN